MINLHKIIFSLFIVCIGVAGFWYFFSTQSERRMLESPRPIEESLPVTDNHKVSQPLREDEEAELRASMDEYGFPKTWDLREVGYRPNLIDFLYKEGDYTYSIYFRETDGHMPIVKESSSTKEYTGLRDDGIFSPDKHHFAFSVDNPFNKTPGVRGELCIAQIDPKVIQCTRPSDPLESYARVGGDYEELNPVGTWVDNYTFKFSVFKKNSVNERGAAENSQPVRTETFTFTK
jgi:hypothetical protein